MLDVILFYTGVVMSLISPVCVVTYIWMNEKRMKDHLAPPKGIFPSAPNIPGYEHVAAKTVNNETVWLLMDSAEYEKKISQGLRMYYIDGTFKWKNKIVKGSNQNNNYE